MMLPTQNRMQKFRRYGSGRKGNRKLEKSYYGVPKRVWIRGVLSFFALWYLLSWLEFKSYDGPGEVRERHLRERCEHSPFKDELVGKYSERMQGLTKQKDTNGVKGVSVVLIRGHEDVRKYSELRKWLEKTHQKMAWLEKYDLLIFHEGDVLPEHQKYITHGVLPAGVKAHERTHIGEAELNHIKFVNVHDMSDEAFRIPDFIGNFTLPTNTKNVGYLHMCRFFSLLLFPMLWDKYDYVLRMDDDLHIIRNVNYDMFQYIHENQYAYAYSVQIPEWHRQTRKTFGVWMVRFLREYEDKFPLIRHYTDEELMLIGKRMYFTNFFITKLDWWKQGHVQRWLNEIDRTGQIYYSRWGDAPIQSTTLTLFSSICDVAPLCDFWYQHGSTGHTIKRCHVELVNNFVKLLKFRKLKHALRTLILGRKNVRRKTWRRRRRKSKWE